MEPRLTKIHWATGQTSGLQFSGGAMIRIFLFTAVSRSARGHPACGVKLTTHFHLVPKLRIRGAIPPLPHYIFMT